MLGEDGLEETWFALRVGRKNATIRMSKDVRMLKMNDKQRVNYYARGTLSGLKQFLHVEKWPVNQPDESGSCLIHHTITSPHALDNIGFLIDNGADVNATNFYGLTPLYIAVEYGLVCVVKLLLRSGADTERLCHSNTPLMRALNAHQLYIETDFLYSLDTAHALIEHGARLHKQTYWPWMENLRVKQIDTVQRVIFTFILCCKRTLVIDKNVVKHIAQIIWNTRWDPAWRTLPDSGKRMHMC
jgi:hypothetical protein